jgi:hypothetical protein
MISTKYDYNQKDYYFSRLHSGEAPEKMRVLRPLWHEAALLAAVLFLWLVVW